MGPQESRRGLVNLKEWVSPVALLALAPEPMFTNVCAPDTLVPQLTFVAHLAKSRPSRYPEEQNLIKPSNQINKHKRRTMDTSALHRFYLQQ